MTIERLPFLALDGGHRITRPELTESIGTMPALVKMSFQHFCLYGSGHALIEPGIVVRIDGTSYSRLFSS